MDGTSSCWATHTGVQGATGYSEGQIEAGAPGFTHHNGDLTIATPGTMIDHEWISGCVAIMANNVTIKDSLITPNGDSCTGGINGIGKSQASAINNGTNTTGTLITDTTVDGGSNNSQAYGVSIAAGTVTRTNSFGFVDPFWSDGQGDTGSTTQLVWSGDYSHDLAGPPGYTGGGHEQNFMFYGATYLTLTDSYAISNGGDGAITGALNWQPGGSGSGDYSTQSPVSHVDVDHSFLDGVGGVNIIGSCGVGGNTIVANNVLDSGSGVSYWRTSGSGPHGSAGPGNVWSGNVSQTSATYPDPGTSNC